MSEADKNKIIELEARIRCLEDEVGMTPSGAAKLLRKINTENNIKTQPKVKIKEKK